MNEDGQALAWTIDSASGARIIPPGLGLVVLLICSRSVQQTGNHRPQIHPRRPRTPHPLQNTPQWQIVRPLPPFIIAH